MDFHDELASKINLKKVFLAFRNFFISSYYCQLISFVSLCLLVRYLKPSDFGIVALGTFFFSIGQQLTEFGSEKALIYRKSSNDNIIYTHTFIQVSLAFCHLLLSIFLSVFVYHFYGKEISYAMLMLTIGRVIQSFGSTSRSMLEKELHFGRISAANIISSTFSLIVLIMLARMGLGYWLILISGVGSGLLGIFLQNLGYVLCYRKNVFRIKEVKKADIYWFWHYCKPMWLGAQTTTLVLQYDKFIVGSFLGKEMLGFYDVAYKYARYALSGIMVIISKVTLSVYAKIQKLQNELESLFSLMFRLIFRIVFPVFLALISSAKEVVLVLSSEKWLPVIPVLQLLLLLFIILSLNEEISAFFFGIGSPISITKYWLIIAFIMIPLVPLGTAFLGIKGAALAVIFAWLVGITFAFVYVRKFINIDLVDIIAKPFFTGIATLITNYFFLRLIPIHSPVFNLAVKSIFTLCIFFFLLIIFDKKNIYKDIKKIKNVWLSRKLSICL